MKNFATVILGFISLISLVSCSTAGDSAVVEPAPVKENVFDGKVGPISGRLDVYNSIARTVKYNIDIAANNMAEKVNPTSLAAAKDTLQGIINVQNQNENPLYTGVRALDFAILYASSNLIDDNDFRTNNLYDKAAQNLAKAAIKTHQDALFSIKKGREIERVMSREKKAVSDLNKKFDKNGRLSQEDLALKKNLEVSLLRLSELRTAFAVNVMNYAKLVKANDLDKVEVEGKKFYELYDFDKTFTIEAFQNTAFKNREELMISRTEGSQKTFNDVHNAVLMTYPEIERLKINGYGLGRPAYTENLRKRSVNIASELVDKVVKYQSITNEKDKQSARVEAFNELNAAIFAQIELAYNLVYASDEDLKDIMVTVKELKKKSAELDEKYRLDPEQRAEALEVKIKLFENEAQMSQILGERAMAIRSLYFYAGFSPFTKKFLSLDIKDMVRELKNLFNKDMVEMLAVVPSTAGVSERANVNDWAKGNNWLEDLYKEPKKAKATAKRDDLNKYEPYSGDVYNQRKKMQLGSYVDRSNLHRDWLIFKEQYPELQAYDYKVEKAKVDGKSFYRMFVSSPKGGFRDLCNKMRADKIECILR